MQREIKQDESTFWKEPSRQASLWSPCADREELTSAGKDQFTVFGDL